MFSCGASFLGVEGFRQRDGLSRGCHLAALLRAQVAGLGALLTVCVCMLAAFVAARLTDVGTQRANCLGVCAAARHCGCSHCANLGTFDVEFDAFRHHRDVGFMETGCSAMVAGRGARVASFNAGVEWVLGHWSSFEKVGLRSPCLNALPLPHRATPCSTDTRHEPVLIDAKRM